MAGPGTHAQKPTRKWAGVSQRVTWSTTREAAFLLLFKGS